MATRLKERIEAPTRNELVEALRQKSPSDAPPDAMTVIDLAKALGLGLSATRARLRKLRESGQLEQWTVFHPDANGVDRPSPAYTFKGKA